ncbi:MAG: hypothetical protein JSS86_15150 [Cyanobacteria bacterium SZAS LIN-2]|nr:hypothetical protein [Cyanobacteria bacterium SZAS LIN-2]
MAPLEKEAQNGAAILSIENADIRRAAARKFGEDIARLCHEDWMAVMLRTVHLTKFYALADSPEL